MSTSNLKQAVTKDRFDAVLFDLDGVLTDTARVHADCWKRLFDDFLRRRAAELNEPFRPFEIATDYKLYVDGRPRSDGIRGFLESRSIQVPYGDPESPPNNETICGLGNLKDGMVKKVLDAEGVEAYEGSVAFVHHVRSQGIKTAVVSASSNCETVLKAAGIADLFDARVDGKDIAQLKLAGKPAPDTFLKAAEELGVAPKHAVIVEDAISGVQAGRDGGFGLVIGVDRKDDAKALSENGADIVVTDVGEMLG